MQMTEWNRVNAMEHCGSVEKVLTDLKQEDG